LRVDGFAQWSRDPCGAPRSTACREHRVERAFTAIGKRQFDNIVEPGPTDSRGHRARGFICLQGSSKLVRTDNRACHNA
jgi:hypothetical protein